MSRSRLIQTGIVGATLALLIGTTGYATPYVPEEQLLRELEERNQTEPAGPNRPALPLPSELDDYIYPEQMRRVLDWLTIMQNTNPGAEYGGEHEGEQVMDIIQTDNTQEALRDWARYGYLTGDTSLYREYIDRAWVYILNWPAYDEEGGGNPNYYRVHNCGWGLVATMEYMRTYEDDTYLWYGDSCATYLDTYRLGMTDNLNPLAAGFGAGCLYLYGVWRENQDWIDASQEIANQVKTWIEANPDRLNNNEIWAMSGGTAMWGVVTALYIDDPEAGQAWLPTYIPSMDVYSGAGNWNNSWTIWYGHAWHQIYRVMGDEGYFDNAVWTVDFLLDQDEPDGDGGVPGTENHYTDDQSWTSAYLVWYGIEPILDHDQTFDYDAAVSSVSSPGTIIPLSEGQEVAVTVRIANAGFQSWETAGITATTDQGYSGSGQVEALGFGQMAEVTLTPGWIPMGPAHETLTVVVNLEGDENQVNDTLRVTFEVESSTVANGRIYDTMSDLGIHSRVDFYLLDSPFPDSVLYSTETNPNNGNYMQHVVPGVYRITATPHVPPYIPNSIDSVQISAPGQEGVDIVVSEALVMLVSEQPEGIYDNFFLESLNELGVSTYLWDTDERGYPLDTVRTVAAVIWSTGDLDEDIFPTSSWNEINHFLDEGGSLLLTGQGLQNVWGGRTVFRTRLGVTDGEMDLPNQRFLLGDDMHPISRGDSLLIFGPGSAWNQESPDEVVPFDSVNAHTIFSYPNGLSAAVAYESPGGGYRTIFCGFGVEAINSEHEDYMTRAEFLRRALVWFEVIEDGIDEGRPGSSAIPKQFSVQTWPNPFNSTVRIGVAMPQAGPLGIRVYDILGRLAARWEPGVVPVGEHQFAWDSDSRSAGVYFLRVEAGGNTSIRKLYLLK